MSKMTKQVKAMQAALTALKSIDAAMPFPVAKFAIHHLEEALAEALAQDVPETNFGNTALDKMAENARELGLDYEPAAGTQVSKVWWDGEKLMAKPISLESIYKKPEQPAQQEPLTGGDERRHIICLCPDCTKPAQQQEPVALGYMNAGHVHEMQQGRLPYGYVYPKEGAGARVAVYTSPPAQRTWQGLTHKEHMEIMRGTMTTSSRMAAVEDKLREKNT